MFAVGFKLGKPVSHNQCTKGIGQVPRFISPMSGRGLGGKKEGWHTLGLVFIHRVNFPLYGGHSQMLFLCSLGHCSQALIPPARPVLHCQACEKKASSDQIRFLLSGEQAWSGFQAMETSYTQAERREHWAEHWPYHLRSG